MAQGADQDFVIGTIHNEIGEDCRLYGSEPRTESRFRLKLEPRFARSLAVEPLEPRSEAPHRYLPSSMLTTIIALAISQPSSPFSFSTCNPPWTTFICPPPWGNVSSTACLSTASGLGTPIVTSTCISSAVLPISRGNPGCCDELHRTPLASRHWCNPIRAHPLPC